jgi:hypothetical protein
MFQPLVDLFNLSHLYGVSRAIERMMVKIHHSPFPLVIRRDVHSGLKGS